MQIRTSPPTQCTNRQQNSDSNLNWDSFGARRGPASTSVCVILSALLTLMPAHCLPGKSLQESLPFCKQTPQSLERSLCFAACHGSVPLFLRCVPSLRAGFRCAFSWSYLTWSCLKLIGSSRDPVFDSHYPTCPCLSGMPIRILAPLLVILEVPMAAACVWFCGQLPSFSLS